MAKAERKKSPINEHMLEVEGTTSIGDAPAPGTSKPFMDVHLEDLGPMSEFPELQNERDIEEGVGDYCVVLADYFSGATDYDNFVKGDVVRLSKLIPGYTDKKVSRDIIKGRILRHFQNGSLRKASSDEIGVGRIEVTLESESQTVQSERNRRIALERENEILRQRLGMAYDAKVAATPGLAGASEEAQDAVGDDDSGSETETKDPDWEV
jgi:hypothetical protein